MHPREIHSTAPTETTQWAAEQAELINDRHANAKQAQADVGELLEMIEDHHKFTGSTVAGNMLNNWPDVLKDFVKVMPQDYKRVLMERKSHDEEQESEVHAEGPNN